MRNRFLPALFVALAFLAGSFGLGRAAYNGVFANDGTYTWYWQLNASHQAVLLNATGNPPVASSAMLTIDPTAGAILPASTVGNLPACSATFQGALRLVTDANATTYNSTAAGSGANVMTVMCNGTNWVLH